MTKDTDGQEHASSSGLKPYEPPQLVEYGSISKLTQGSFTVGNDSGAGFMNMQCL